MIDVEVLPAVVDLEAIKSYRGNCLLHSHKVHIFILVCPLPWTGGAASLLDLDAQILMACKLPVLDSRHFSLQDKTQTGHNFNVSHYLSSS